MFKHIKRYNNFELPAETFQKCVFISQNKLNMGWKCNENLDFLKRFIVNVVSDNSTCWVLGKCVRKDPATTPKIKNTAGFFLCNVTFDDREPLPEQVINERIPVR